VQIKTLQIPPNNGELLMAAELRECPDVVFRQSDLLSRPIGRLCDSLKESPPRLVVTCARGSSAYAAVFGKHLIERYLGFPVAAAAPSITTVYKRNLRLEGQFFLAISQSGGSDDLIETTTSARAAGALTAAIVNDVNSPLAAACDIVLPMAAGPELSVASTKTFIASLTALLRFIAAWANEASLSAALDRLPGRVAEAARLDWSNVVGAISSANSLATLGRGPTLAIAQEAALKLKEVCNLHAEAYSGAEFQHGPIALVSSGYPVLIFWPSDKSAEPLTALTADLCHKGAAVFITGHEDFRGVVRLPTLERDHPETDAVCLIQSFYGLAIRLAAHRGINVDQPRNLQKVTRTR
jgi:glucosamine--fructose-6-phosphate aminotransferase (isomerizing)